MFNREFADLTGGSSDPVSPGMTYESFIRRGVDAANRDESDLDGRVNRILGMAGKAEPFADVWQRDGGSVLEMRCRPLAVAAGGLAVTLVEVDEGEADDDPVGAFGTELRKILEGSPIAVGITAPGDRLVFHNARWSEMAGIPHAEGASVDLRAMFKNQSDRELLAKELRDKDFVRDVEMEFLRVGGEAMWVLVSMHRMKLEGETLTIGWFSDVTARKQTGEKLREARDELELRVEERTHDLSREVEGHKKTERALRTSEERLRDLAEAGSDWFWEMDRELKFSRVSGRLADTIGVGPDFLIGKSRSDLAVSAGDDEKWKAHADDLENRRPFRDFRYEITRPDGAIQYVETSGKPIFDKKEEFVGYRGTGSSVTAQVEAEKRAAKAQEQLIDAIESLADAFILFDADDRFVLCNSKYQEYYPVAARLLKPGIKFRDLIEQSIEMGELGDTGRSNEEIVKDRLERFRNATEPFFQQLKNGRWLRVGEHRTSDGGTVSIRTDVSDLRRAEEEARAAKEEAENVQDRLVTAIESLSEGFQLFDSEDRFVLCNAKYKDFYPSIADLCVPGTPFEEILRVFAASGESEEALANPEKWIAERMEKHNNPGQPFQQLLSSGRWLQISEHKTKDGGIVSLRTRHHRFDRGGKAGGPGAGTAHRRHRKPFRLLHPVRCRGPLHHRQRQGGGDVRGCRRLAASRGDVRGDAPPVRRARRNQGRPRGHRRLDRGTPGEAPQSRRPSRLSIGYRPLAEDQRAQDGGRRHR